MNSIPAQTRTQGFPHNKGSIHGFPHMAEGQHMFGQHGHGAMPISSCQLMSISYFRLKDGSVCYGRSNIKGTLKTKQPSPHYLSPAPNHV